jgi:Skp family chaperone for outer membrane proteins
VLDVKTSLRFAALAIALGTTLAAGTVLAQEINGGVRPTGPYRPNTGAVGGAPVSGPQSQPQAQPQRPRSPIAVIDISRIFKEYPRFRAMLDEMKKDVDAAEAALRREGEELQNLAKQMKQYGAGTPDYRRIEETISSRSIQLQTEKSRQQRAFMDREAKIYFDVYSQIENEVAYFAQRYGFEMVLRFNDVEMDNPGDRQKILQAVNKAVVYHHPQLDITQPILDRLTRPEAARPQGVIPGTR